MIVTVQKSTSHFSRNIFLILFFVTSVCFSSFGNVKLSEHAKASLVTVAPGTELYSGFGHSVIWIFDPQNGLDNAYSYGTFNFETGNFYLKFLRGTLPYSISVAPLAPQLNYWAYENRGVKEQVLNLSAQQKQQLYDFLEHNYLPENREYQYKFFYDNCATRLSVALKAACGDNLDYKGYTKEALSFRQWIDRYAYKQNPWADFGMDLAIGAPSDEIATPEQATFLPDNLSAAFQDAKVKVGESWEPLVLEQRTLFQAAPTPAPFWLTPMIFFWALAALVLAYTVWQSKYEKINFTLDRILFGLAGFIGWIIVLLWFGTNHGVTVLNYDLLWAFPMLLPSIFLLSPKGKPKWFHMMLIFYTFMLLCATGNLLKHNYVVIPILLMLIIRVYYMNNVLAKIPTKE
jgi:hypothetical protein